MQKVSDNLIDKENFGIKGRFKIISYKAGTKEKIYESDWNDNLVMLGTNTGKSLILQRLIGTNTYTLNINYAGIGTSQVAPAVTDTQLGTEVARIGSPSSSITSNVASMQFFFPDASLANGTYYEIGTFIDASATLNSGQIFNRALFAIGYVKSSNVDTTVQVDFTIN